MVGSKLHYKKLGSGPNLVILHGLYGSLDNWMTVAKRLENRFTVWIIDQRNHGQSPHTETHSYEEMAQDLFQFFNFHNIKLATILGHSMGGKVAMLFALRFANLVEKLIIVDIAPKSYLNSDTENFAHVAQHNVILQLINDIDLSTIKTRSEIDNYFAQKLPDVSLRLFLLKNIHRNKLGNFEWKINVRVLTQSLSEMLGGINKATFINQTPIKQYPVIFIRGLNSDYIGDADVTIIKSIYPDAEIVDIEDAGHWLHAEQTELFLQTIMTEN